MIQLAFTLCFFNDKYDKYDIIRSNFKLALNWQQPKVCSIIRLEVMTIKSGIDENWMGKMDDKKSRKKNKRIDCMIQFYPVH